MRDLNAEAARHTEHIMRLYRTAVGSPKGYQAISKACGGFTARVGNGLAPRYPWLDQQHVMAEIARWVLGDRWEWHVQGYAPAVDSQGGIPDVQLGIVIGIYVGEKMTIELDFNTRQADIEWLSNRHVEGKAIECAELVRFGHFCRALVVDRRYDASLDGHKATFELREVYDPKA